MAMPFIIKSIHTASLNADEQQYFSILKNWNLRHDVGSAGATVFVNFWKEFEAAVFADEYAKAPENVERPLESTLLEAVLKDSAWKFLDNVTTQQTETLADNVMTAFKKAAINCKAAQLNGKLAWDKYKATHIDHLAKLPAFSRSNLPIGGGTHIINATRDTHGPSWRMVIELTQKTNAHGVYPGGQSGNPGSKFYDSFVDTWAAGKYYELWMMAKGEEKDNRIKWVMHFTN